MFHHKKWQNIESTNHRDVYLAWLTTVSKTNVFNIYMIMLNCCRRSWLGVSHDQYSKQSKFPSLCSESCFCIMFYLFYNFTTKSDLKIFSTPRVLGSRIFQFLSLAIRNQTRCNVTVILKQCYSWAYSVSFSSPSPSKRLIQAL